MSFRNEIYQGMEAREFPGALLAIAPRNFFPEALPLPLRSTNINWKRSRKQFGMKQKKKKKILEKAVMPLSAFSL